MLARLRSFNAAFNRLDARLASPGLIVPCALLGGFALFAVIFFDPWLGPGTASLPRSALGIPLFGAALWLWFFLLSAGLGFAVRLVRDVLRPALGGQPAHLRLREELLDSIHAANRATGTMGVVGPLMSLMVFIWVA